ncbi:hypothetical protein B5M09_005826 [Aphanomyces astaci]|uniref:Uncharacterized protein n=1 Tax=Aphanomyces astaci TaxID=112090 RepID=A0A425DA65_APHAT|nr:hypothetical protein B5M09_005826 [Aphanomyces astaci]
MTESDRIIIAVPGPDKITPFQFHTPVPIEMDGNEDKSLHDNDDNEEADDYNDIADDDDVADDLTEITDNSLPEDDVADMEDKENEKKDVDTNRC